MLEGKRKVFHDIQEAMKKAMRELKEKDSIIDIKEENLTGDKLLNKRAEDSLDLLSKVETFISENNYESASTLIRHVYRVSPSKSSRTPLARARLLCKEAMALENKWVKRRATLRRKKTKSSVIKSERKKYEFEKKKDLHDLLATAILEISEGIDKRGGEFFTSLSGLYEVVLPPLIHGEFITSSVPVLFNSETTVDERKLKESMSLNHNFAPDIKTIERNLYVMRNMPLVGFSRKLSTSNDFKSATLELSSSLGKSVQIVDYCLTHKSSPLFWYVFNMPIKFHTLQFADNMGVDDYGDLNRSLDHIEGSKISRDEFVKLREATRLNNIRRLRLSLQTDRENFAVSNRDLIAEIKSVNNSILEISETIAGCKNRFAELTSLEMNEENKGDKGLAISQYKKLHTHMDKLFDEIRSYNDEEDDALYTALKSDRFEARYTYYEYLEATLYRKVLKNRVVSLQEELARAMHLARGTGKSMKNAIMAD